jgi:hypothetical protein
MFTNENSQSTRLSSTDVTNELEVDFDLQPEISDE